MSYSSHDLTKIIAELESEDLRKEVVQYLDEEQASLEREIKELVDKGEKIRQEIAKNMISSRHSERFNIEVQTGDRTELYRELDETISKLKEIRAKIQSIENVKNEYKENNDSLW
ncbi:MAG: hypothetical protein FH756_01610 [Firmicutes bacterium]|nr:hypothetical protein [Bacillota bacterium]